MSRKKLLVEIIIIVLFLSVVGYLIGLSYYEKPATEKELNNYLEKMGKDFYTTFYYKEVTNKKTKKEYQEYLKKFETIGIKVSLRNLSMYNNGENDTMIKRFKNESKEECDKDNTKVIIYPKYPYEKNNYEIKTVLKCNFDSKVISSKKVK